MQLDIDAILEDLAERIAAKLRDHGGSNNGPRLLSLEDAAAYIGRTKPGLDHLIAARKIPTVRADRRVQIDVRDLDEWIENNKT
jgi:excisionase family DNA binding protein